MTKRLLPVLLVALLACASGCTFFKKSSKPKESTAISSEVETEFRQRWVDKRVADLVAQGTPAATARERALTEYQQRYSYALPAQK